MNNSPRVILSGFADEAANNKTIVEQFAAFAALGLEYFSIRFIDVGSGIKNVMKLSAAEIQKVRRMQEEYGLKVSSIGSPIGKIKLKDVDDGTKNAYVPFKKYLNREVKKVCDLAHAFETKLIRGFSFYHPRGSDPRDHLSQAADQLAMIAEVCSQADVIFGLEIEANLIGSSGAMLADIYKRVNHPALVLIYDAGNVITQGCTTEDVYAQYLAMKPGLGWMHIKDYRHPQPVKKSDYIDEDALAHFVPADMGEGAHEMIFRDFREYLPALEKKIRRRGVPGVFLELEPHLKGGGQFGGFSGPDGMGVALRGLCRLLDYLGIDYHLHDFNDVKAARNR
ncbi:MAG: sugar phosphate isomerase/epimerase family protein [Thermoguttaceae bacterium]